MAWKKFNGEVLRKSILEEVGEVVRHEYETGNKLKVCIGTDSQVKGLATDFATVIVFLREKKGAFMYIQQERSYEKMSIKRRMLSEVQRSIGIAYELCSLLDQYKIGLEVHADINTDPKFKSNEALHEAMGYILGMGFVFRAKPEAFASSSCANKMVQ